MLQNGDLIESIKVTLVILVTTFGLLLLLGGVVILPYVVMTLTGWSPMVSTLVSFPFTIFGIVYASRKFVNHIY